MITNIEPSTSEFLMSVDIVGCPAKKALYSQDEPEVMHKEVHKNHVHQGYQHHGHQCAKHRFLAKGTDAVLDRIYPPDSRDLILTATIKDSAESTLSINASLVDALMEEGQQQQNNNKEVDKATKSDGNLEGALKNTQNGSPNDAANKDQQGNNTATGGAGKDNPNGNGNNGGRCNKNDTCKKKKCKKAKKLNGDDDEDEDADKEECDTKCIKKNPCILSKENMEKKVSDMTNNFLHKLNCAGAPSKKRVCCTVKNVEELDEESCTSSCDIAEDECCPCGSLALIFKQAFRTIHSMMQLLILLAAYVCVCMAKVLITFYRAPRWVQVFAMVGIALVACTACLDRSVLFRTCNVDTPPPDSGGVQVEVIVNDKVLEDCSETIDDFVECTCGAVGGCAGGGAKPAPQINVPRGLRPAHRPGTKHI